MNPAFTQLESAEEGQELAKVYCAGCPALSDCMLLAVATLEQFGSLFGVWAGQVFRLNSGHRT